MPLTIGHTNTRIEKALLDCQMSDESSEDLNWHIICCGRLQNIDSDMKHATPEATLSAATVQM